MRETHTQRQRYRQREKQASYRKPNVGLDLRTLGSCPGPKVDAQPLGHPTIAQPPPPAIILNPPSCFDSDICQK